ncbi:MAG: NADH-quinone oxidoreductase subunit NuoE [Actinomycetota bacterium]|nr:MAG: NADH-quinone oxidoreductase subunit NuoE [Actinomycetota bacterium]
MALTETTRTQAAAIAARYPQSRSALLPLLHLVQADEGVVSAAGIALCAEVMGLTTAEVAAVATFYTMYKRRPVGTHHIGVCTNTLCGLLGGDDVYRALSDRLGIGHDESTADGSFTLEHIECQAACTHAPVMTVDWEFVDRVTVSDALDVVDRLARGEQVQSTRGPAIRDFVATERTLAGFDDDGLAAAGGAADDLMLAGLRRAKALGQSAPAMPGQSSTAAPATSAEGS